MERKYDVIALGELLIDFTDSGLSDQGNPLLEANPGGAPCNVLSMLAKLSRKTAFIGKVGKDMFGRQLRETIRDVGIDDACLLDDEKVHTTLAFVKTYENGDRDFSFYRDPGADMMLKEEDLPLDMLKQTRVFHFGTLSMTHEDVRKVTKKAVETAKAAGAVISFDPNLRPPLWDDLENAKEQIDWGLKNSDIVKIADNELQFMCGEEDLEKCAEILRERYPNIKVLNATYGAEGSCSYCKDHRVYVPAFKLGGTIETTGAGDTFCACTISYILDHPVDDLKEEDLREMLRFANAAAYLVTTKKGAIRSMPDPEEVYRILGTVDIDKGDAIMNTENLEVNERGDKIIETVELSITQPKAGTVVTGEDPSGFDQTPIPCVTVKSDRYAIGKVNVNGIERDEVYWKDYATLVLYSDVKLEEGKTYNVFGRVQAKPGYVFYDPVNLIVNGEEVSPLEIEDYSLEGDSFCFYCDIKVVE